MIKKVYKINHSFNCDTECLIYLFLCKFFGIQYVGSTSDRFWLRWNNYKSCQRNVADGRTPNQNYFHQHFLSDGHNRLMNDCHRKRVSQILLEGDSFGWGYLKPQPHWVLILMKVTIIKFYQLLITMKNKAFTCFYPHHIAFAFNYLWFKSLSVLTVIVNRVFLVKIWLYF